MSATRHVLGISGGRDSAALAVFMSQHRPELDIEYFFTDTGKELPEVYEFLGKLEGFLGKPIERLNPDRDFDFWLKEYRNFLPSPRTRWCTRKLKIAPFEEWLRPSLKAGVEVHSYVAIRADENFRDGYIPTQTGLQVHLPFRTNGIDKEGVSEILKGSGVGLPTYYDWRTRSGCTFCFYQQKIEWLGLAERHPEAFADAQSYEKNAMDHGSPFTWNEGETLAELIAPERAAAIKADHEKRIQRALSRRRQNPLDPATDFDLDDVYGSSKVCLSCHK